MSNENEFENKASMSKSTHQSPGVAI